VKTCNTDYEDLLAGIVGTLLGGGVVVLRPVPTYPDTIVYEASSGGRTVVFKAVEPEGRDADGIAAEAWTCERADKAGVPAPRVLEVDTSHSRFPSSFFVMEKAAGESLASLDLPDWELQTVLERLGAHVAALHEIAVGGFGPLSAAGRGRSDTWRAALLDDVPAALDYLARVGALTGAEIAGAQRAVDDGSPVLDECTDARLLHGDLGLLHVFADPATLRVTSLVEFGECAAGDPAYDFRDFDSAQLRPLLAGYGAPEEFAQRIPYYVLVQAISWAAKWHARGEQQVVEFLKDVIGASR